MVTLCAKKADGGHIDDNLVKQYENESEYLKQLLQRIINVIKLAFVARMNI